MSLTDQVLLLVLSFPAVGLLLYVLWAVEERLPGSPRAGNPRRRADEAAHRTRSAPRARRAPAHKRSA